MTTNVKLMVVLQKLNYVFLDKLGKNLDSLGMSTSMYSMLAHLNDVEKAKTQRLGEVAIITSGTITHIVNKMVQLGYVRKSQCEDDKRITWVEITNAGRITFNSINKQHMVFLDALLADFHDAEKQAFIEQIKLFGKSIEQKEII